MEKVVIHHIPFHTTFFQHHFTSFPNFNLEKKSIITTASSIILGSFHRDALYIMTVDYNADILKYRCILLWPHPDISYAVSVLAHLQQESCSSTLEAPFSLPQGDFGSQIDLKTLTGTTQAKSKKKNKWTKWTEWSDYLLFHH